MARVAELAVAVIGGDTHADSHTLQIAAPSSAPIATGTFDNTEQGHAQVLAWLIEHLPPAPQQPAGLVVVGLEGTRSYGVGLARALSAAGLLVVEVDRPARAGRRGRGKSDAIDARHAVLQVLAMDADRLPTPRADGDREALRILLTARHDLVTSRTRANNRLVALLRTGQDQDRTLLAASSTTASLVQAVLRRRHVRGLTREQVVRREEARRLARAVQSATAELKTNLQQLAGLVGDLAPALLDKPGVGPVSAAQVLVSFSHTGRVRNEAAFAALAGTAPLPASSGRTTRHRLNRGGDRALNGALHDIARNRMTHAPRTRHYTARRRQQGLSDREIRRCLKRYISRELYRALDKT